MNVMLEGTYVEPVYVKLVIGSYENKRIAVKAITETFEHIATLTVNLPGANLSSNKCSYFKNYSENAGLLECLEKQGVVKRTGVVVKSGHVEIPEVEWLKEEIYNESMQSS